MTRQVYPIDTDQGAATAERLVVAQAAHAALLVATVALDRVEATVCADVVDPAYRAVAARRSPLEHRCPLRSADCRLIIRTETPCYPVRDPGGRWSDDLRADDRSAPAAP